VSLAVIENWPSCGTETSISDSIDEQATHGTSVTGTVHARGLKEAPDHVKLRSSEDKVVSREWHSLLRFRAHLGVPKRLLTEYVNQGRSTEKSSM
jgi:hypothetical protein